MKDSLRIRLMMGIATGSLVLLCLLSTFIYTITKYSLTRHFDRSLLNTAHLLTAVVESEEIDQNDHQDNEEGKNNRDDSFSNGLHKIEFEFDVRMTPEFNTPAGGTYYQIRNRDKSINIKSPSLDDQELIDFEELTQNPQYKKCILINDIPGRCVGFRFISRGEGLSERIPLSLVLARDASELYQHLSFLRWLLTISSIIVILFSLIIAMIITKLSLKPIGRLADNISQVNMDNLQDSHISGRYPTELSPIIDCLNNLYQRLRASFDQQHRLNSDIAHELRTPIAGLQSTIEVCLTKPRQTHEYQKSLSACLSIAQSMNHMTESLLSLTRLESNQATIKKEIVSLSKIIQDCWKHFADQAFDRNISFDNAISDEIALLCDKNYLSMAIRNLLDNATEYTNDNGRIWLEAAERADGIILSIANTGCTIEPDQLEKIDEPFWRHDASRTETGKHCGIGLTIVHRIVQALEAEMEAEIESPDIFKIHLFFPKLGKKKEMRMRGVEPPRG